ncbi:PREDICTED: peptide transporter family 1-like [Rhagoletis zephyria]|uniref:peptide transporter family 1-like n=1 Tax=Rhagoletis zephyria TaxID=28612 RepID=UPI0008117A12|nr:PREDICTED: peptide transporter family 1-like [Rhagoletis zephyria]
MTIGGLLAALSFVICAFVQLKIEKEQPVALLPAHHHVVLVNGFAGDCPLGGFHLESPLYNGTISQQTFVLKNIPSDQLADFPATFEDLCRKGERYTVQATFTNLTEGASLLLYIDSVGLKQASGRLSVNSSNVVLYASNVLSKPLEGGALLFTLFNLSHYQSAVNQSADGEEVFTSSDHSGELVAHVLRTTASPPGPVQQANVTLGYLDKFEVEIKGHDIVMGAGEKRAALKLEQGATYVQLISGDLEGEVQFTVTKIVEANQLSVFIQLVQYLVITCAEIMFSVTGLEFSYTQAPQSMKSVLQAAWLLTVAFGNLIVAVIADLKIFPQQSYEFFFFASLMVIDIAIFAVMAYFYAPFRGEPEGAGAVIGTSDHQSGVNGGSSSNNSHSNGKSMQMEPINSKRKTSSSDGWDE